MYKRLRRRENRLRNDGETSNDGDASTQVQQGTYYYAKFAYGGLEG